MKKLILIFMLATLTFAQDATRKTIRNFVTSKPTSVSEAGLVASYNMLLSGSQVVSDISGNGNDGVAFNVDYTFADMCFDGVSSFIQLDGLTIEGNQATFIFNGFFNSTVNDLLLDFNTNRFNFSSNSSGNLALSDGTSTISFGSAPNLRDGNFHSLVFVLDGTTAKAYIDGEQFGIDKTIVALDVSIATEVNLCVRFNEAGNFSKTTINDFSVYEIALTETQIINKFNENIDILLFEGFSYSSLLALDRNWRTESGVYSLSGDTLTASTGGDLTMPLDLSYVDNGYATYELYDGSWNSVAETVDASSVFGYSSGILTMTLATNERIRNIKITSGVEL